MTVTIDTNKFPVTETLNYCGNYNLPETSGKPRQLTLVNCKVNPNNAKVLIGHLVPEDLALVSDDYFKDREDDHINHNTWAFYKHQIIK